MLPGNNSRKTSMESRAYTISDRSSPATFVTLTSKTTCDRMVAYLRGLYGI